ncbi:hypothetical protein ASG40_00260 [Methylobacterium sp. Leaf399]|uniref:hypothetical protein n=1 Tax=unclassified Methylobacterium TaxID=2615210 RepID=UPI0006F54AF6|nr:MULTISPECIES: hypothetical protein [unclassified Methylobacterium]KQT19333.1 hypothetical protein ASG40_00260 [Methylobacterium sp. Leaf399]KQT78267.1 hypothetical protein ASG59_09855 [Methylobacterium sp. Leaf466]
MSVVRRFLVASSLVRLIRKERGGSRISEGYFPPQGGRTSYVRVDGQNCHLVLVTAAPDGGTSEERTEVPRAHGEALLDVCSGKAAYDRTVIALPAGREILLDRYVAPATLDMVSVAFDGAEEAASFAVPSWFGPEVTADPAFDRHAVGINGAPQPGEIALSNAALDAVLDLVEPRFGFGRYNTAPKASEDGSVANTLRRIVGSVPPAAAAAPVAAAAAAPMPPAHIPFTDPAPAEDHESDQPQPPPDTRMEDVFESLSQALGAAVHPPQEPPRDEDGSFERWTVRPRRTQQ